MSYRYWKTSEVRILIDNPQLTDREVGELIGRDRDSVNSYRRRNGLMKPMGFAKQATIRFNILTKTKKAA